MQATGELHVLADNLDSLELRDLTLDAREHLGQLRVRRASRDWIRQATSRYENELRQSRDAESKRLVAEIARNRARWKNELRQQILKVEADLTDERISPENVLVSAEQLKDLYRKLRALEDEGLEELRFRFEDYDYRKRLGDEYRVEASPEYLYVVLAYLAGSISKEAINQATTAGVDFAKRWIKRRLKGRSSNRAGHRVYILGPKGEVLKSVHVAFLDNDISGVDKKRIPMTQGNERPTDAPPKEES